MGSTLRVQETAIDDNGIQVVTEVRGQKIKVAQHSDDYNQWFYKRRPKIEREHGEQGVGWQYWIYRPTHAAANIG